VELSKNFTNTHPTFPLLPAPTISDIKSNKKSYKRVDGKGEGVMIIHSYLAFRIFEGGCFTSWSIYLTLIFIRTRRKSLSLLYKTVDLNQDKILFDKIIESVIYIK